MSDSADSAWPQIIASGAAILLLAQASLTAQTPLDEVAPWPRVRMANGHRMTLHLPQVERWTSNWFSARAAMEVQPVKAGKEWLGVVWFEARASVDHSNRMVTLHSVEITKAHFPEAPDQGSHAIAIVRDVLPAGARTVSLDYLITALGFEQVAARRGPGGFKHDPPRIIWATNHTVLVLIDGEPILRQVTNAPLERVINTPALMVLHKPTGRFFLAGDGRWFSAASLQDPWDLAQEPPPEIVALAPPQDNTPATNLDGPPPRITVSTRPAELLMTGGLPDFRPISGTKLQYAANSDSQLFFHTTEREAYLLLSGRWFKAKSLAGPWTYVAPRDLPPDFAKIPPGSPRAVALASVPGTPQAELALLANSVPTTATVNRREARIHLVYDGAPNFKPIEGTSMSYAVNAQLPVIRVGNRCYALDNGVWFLSTSPDGPWEVAAEVPEEIYTIPPSSPVYYATFVRVYRANNEEVEVGYTPGYQGAFEDEGNVIYGTGWNYEPWVGSDYYGWGWTWGYGYVYVPWYQWWVWRPWWNQPGGLRAAVIENIYDRWRGRNGVTHYDGAWPSAPAAPLTPLAPRAPSAPLAPSAPSAPSAPQAPLAERAPLARPAGYPALYGRFQGAAQPAALAPPANALALNPYSRPPTSVQPGEVPHGAQLLTTIQQTPGGGRDLYASPDGNVYLRKNEGWYRRQTPGNWVFFAPTLGQMERNQVATRRGPQASVGAAVYQPMPGRDATAARMQPRANRVPDTGFEPRAHEVAQLERQYYARSLGQMRAQNWRPPPNLVRPGRAIGRRR